METVKNEPIDIERLLTEYRNENLAYLKDKEKLISDCNMYYHYLERKEAVSNVIELLLIWTQNGYHLRRVITDYIDKETNQRIRYEVKEAFRRLNEVMINIQATESHFEQIDITCERITRELKDKDFL